MNKAKLLLVVDILAFITLLISAITGIMMWLGTRGLKEVHTYASFAFVAIVIVHLLLHYNCLKAMLKK